MTTKPVRNSLTVLPFLLCLCLGLATMPTNVYAVNRSELGHEHAQPWRGRLDGAVQCATASVLVVVQRTIEALRGHPLVTSERGEIALEILTGGLVKMQEHREKLIRDAGDLKGANGAFENDEKRAKFDAIVADVEVLGVKIQDAVRDAKLDEIVRTTLPASQRTETEARLEREDPDKAVLLKGQRVAMLDYIRNGLKMMAPENTQVLRRQFSSLSVEEKRALSTIGGAAGGYTVTPDTRFAAAVIDAMKYFGGIEAAGAEVITTDTGADLPFVTNDDTGNTGTIVAESGSHASGTDLTFGMKVLKSFLYSTKIVLVPWQLLQDSQVDIEAYLASKFGMRLGRAQNAHFSTGIAVNQPEGLMASITVGRQAVTGNSASFPFDDVYRTIHAVDVAYRGARCRWSMHDNTILALRLAKDGNGRYLWPELGNVQVGQPQVLAGYPVVPNNDIAVMAASAKAASFGDHSHYKVRRVSGLTFVRLDELYAASGQVGFMAFQRADGGYVNPGQDAIVAFQNSAS